MLTSNSDSATQKALRAALISRAEELGIDPDTVQCLASRALTAHRTGGALLRLDFGEWSRAELSR